MIIQPKGWMPVYFEPTNQRSEKWAIKNYTHYLLNGGNHATANDYQPTQEEVYQPAKAPIQIIGSVKPRLKKGRIRKLMFTAGIIGFFALHFYMWGWV